MDRKFLFLIGLAFALMLIVGFLIMPSLSNGNKSNEEIASGETPFRGNFPSADYPAEDQGGSLEGVSKTLGLITATKLSDGRFLLENKSGGYQITVSPEWVMSEDGAEFKLFYGDAANLKPGIELNNMAALNIEILSNKNRYEFSEWFKNLDSFVRSDLGTEKNFKKVQTNAGTAFRGYRKSDRIDDFGKVVPKNDSSVVDYLFFKGYKVYRVTCASSGSDYGNLSQICENQIKYFSVK
jgi:hypothetical protein